MTEYAETLSKIAHHPERLDDGDIAALRRACREHPADAVAPAMLLKYAAASLTDEEIAFARARVSLYCGDPATLISAIDPSGKGFDSFYPPLPDRNRPSTAGAIDLFLETYGHQSAEEDALLERMIFNPVPDYAEQLARDTVVPPAPPGSRDQLIDAFLAKETTSKPRVNQSGEKIGDILPTEAEPIKKEQPVPSSKNPSSSLLSESLAKIFIKQGRYERAFEIISNLSLNYPEKSIYFADQLRFLEKLIINQRYAK